MQRRYRVHTYILLLSKNVVVHVVFTLCGGADIYGS